MPSSEAETHAVWVGAIAELLRCRSQSERLSTHLFFTSKGSRGTNIDVFLSALRKRSSRRSTLRFRYSRMQDGSRAQLAKKRAMRMPGVCKSAVSVATTPPRRSPLPPARSGESSGLWSDANALIRRRSARRRAAVRRGVRDPVPDADGARRDPRCHVAACTCTLTKALRACCA